MYILGIPRHRGTHDASLVGTRCPGWSCRGWRRGFPTHVKLAAKADTVLINAAECEPLLHKDKEVLREYADEVIAGLAAGMRLVGADRGIIGIKDKYEDVIDAAAAEAAGRHGHRARCATPTRPATSSSWSTTCSGASSRPAGSRCTSAPW